MCQLLPSQHFSSFAVSANWILVQDHPLLFYKKRQLLYPKGCYTTRKRFHIFYFFLQSFFLSKFSIKHNDITVMNTFTRCGVSPPFVYLGDLHQTPCFPPLNLILQNHKSCEAKHFERGFGGCFFSVACAILSSVCAILEGGRYSNPPPK